MLTNEQINPLSVCCYVPFWQVECVPFTDACAFSRHEVCREASLPPESAQRL